MKKSFMLVAAIMVFAFVAAAQEIPRFETFLGYQFVRYGSATGTTGSFNANGGNGQFAWNFSKWVGVVGDVGLAHNGDVGDAFDISRGLGVSFMAGPRVSLWKWHRFRPYAQALFGGVYYNVADRVLLLTPDDVTNPVQVINPNEVIVARITRSSTHFAMAVGGGIDIRLNKHFMLRPIEADYYRTHISNFRSFDDDHQNNFRYTAGINFTFGER